MNRVALALGLIIITAFAGLSVARPLSVIPGPEGARAVFYGVQFSADSGVLRASSLDALPTGYTWVSNAPSDAAIAKAALRYEPLGIQIVGPSWYYLNDAAALHTELNRPAFVMSDPLGFGTQSRAITFSSLTPTLTGATLTKRTVYMIPAEFIVQINADPSSGVYTWRDLRLWYALDTNVWLNAFAAGGLPEQDPIVENGTIRRTAAAFRGAFPVIAWVGAYQDWQFKDPQGNIRTTPPDENARAFVSVSPSLQGRVIDMFKSPSSRYELGFTSEIVANPQLLEQTLKASISGLPDPRFASTVYFPITLSGFGAYVKPTGLFGSYLSHEKWYPAIYYRVRVLYAVYGEWVYVWTKQTEQQVAPKWENRTATVTVTTDPLSGALGGLTAWLSNPFNLAALGIFGGLFLVAVILIILAIFAPGLLGFLGAAAGRKRRP